MPVKKTNSNSMTSIFIVALNNKKSGFRSAFFELIEAKDDNSTFFDGTHTSIDFDEINGKQIDIIGRKDGKTTFLIEIKVGNDEKLQDSQAKNGGKSGEYEKVYKAHKNEIKSLIYIIPDDYDHKNELPSGEGIKILYWSKILNLSKEYDDYEIGCNFSLKKNGDKNFFIGLNPSLDEEKLDYCFALAIY